MRSYLGAGFERRFVGLCVPPLALGLVDGSLTLVGQSSFYWQDYLAVNEANPVFASLLQVHPVAFLAGAVAWLAMLCTLILVLPRLAALILSIAITFGHTIGSGNWLFNHFELGYHLANGYYLLSACVLGLGIRYAMASGMPDADVLNVPANVRAKIGGAVFVLGALLWLFPWQH
jgi:hypothetical protein